MENQQITVETLVKAPVADAWAAFTSPDAITQWNFASDDWCCPSAQVDLREGGAYTARMEAKDGSYGFDLEAVYAEVAPGQALTMVLLDGRKARTTFAETADGTQVTTVFDAETQNDTEMQREGWQAILENFRAYVESRAAIAS